jgi:hypothetical protein
MNALLDKAEKWLTELGIRVQARPTCLMVNRDDIDSLCGIGVVYDEFLKELREALGTNKYYWSAKDREWLYLDCW